MRPIFFAAVFVLALALAATAVASQPRAGATDEQALLAEVNRVRAAHRLPSLRSDVRLVRAARAHTSGMLRTKVFAHGDIASRLRRFGVSGRVGENLAWGTGSYTNPAAIVRMWLASPTHRANLLRPGFRRIGLAAATGAFNGHAGAVVVTADFQGS